MGVFAAPDVARIDLAGQPVAQRARARALWSRQRGMVFTVTNLPALPPVSAGLLTPDALAAARCTSRRRSTSCRRWPWP